MAEDWLSGPDICRWTEDGCSYRGRVGTSAALLDIMVMIFESCGGNQDSTERLWSTTTVKAKVCERGRWEGDVGVARLGAMRDCCLRGNLCKLCSIFVLLSG